MWRLSLVLIGLLPMTVEGGERIPLYTGAVPGSENASGEEMTYHSDIFQTRVVTNVSTPTLEAFLPENGNGAAVVIAPGGGFHALSIDSEGNDVARWLNERGVAAFVLRYRLVPGGEDVVAELVKKTPEQAQLDMASVAPLAGADGLAAMRLVRSRAEEFGVDAQRIGFMGFSAGGTVAMSVAAGYEETSRPAFLAPIYASTRSLPDWELPEDVPPIFLVAATDDQLGLAPESIRIYERWVKAGIPAELHLYAEGGHGFGMRTQNLPSDSWIDRFGEWLIASGFVKTP
jgi:acetyl esterase/lipase